MLEGGGLYLWNNTVTGFKEIVDMDLVRSNNLTYSEGSSPGDWGYCSASAINGVAGLGPEGFQHSRQNVGPGRHTNGGGAGELLERDFFVQNDTATRTIICRIQALVAT